VTGAVTIGAVVLGVVGLATTAQRGHRPAGGAPTQASAPPAHALPRRMSIPAIGVDKPLVELSAGKNQTMELPPTNGLGWYDGSASPGDPGAAVITGFIRVGGHPGALSRLGRLHRGSRIDVARSDGAEAIYTVDRIASYSPGKFPVSQVYRATAKPTLRIVTTGGRLRADQPAGNVVVYATLSRIRSVNSSEAPRKEQK